jgi:glycogen debranching enzyme
MPLEVQVGPPLVTINRGNTFLVTELDGSITDATDQGLFSSDTRYISRYQLYVDGYRWTLLNSGAISYCASRAYLTNPLVETRRGSLAGGVLGLSVGRTAGEGIHEDIDIRNYSQERASFNLELLIRSDFADIFEVKEKKFVRKGHIETVWSQELQELANCYSHEDFHRSLLVRIKRCPSKAGYGNGRINFAVVLEPGASWHSCWFFHVVEGGRPRSVPRSCISDTAKSSATRDLDRWKEATTQITTSNEDFYRLYRQSVEDMAALRLNHQDGDKQELLIAAGVPWFVTIFGRDSLIVSLQNMIVYPEFARGTLEILAKLQATETDDYRDAEPGKIPHELRSGELAHFKLIPHTPYYGTADATILYLITLHEAWKWLGDDLLFPHYKEVATKCLEWIDRYGDRDGDGFQEYQTRSKHGYENMGWKDAGDSVMYPDGSPVKGPKALCELQGYVYNAKLRVAEGAEHLGESELADRLRREAAQLQERFEEQFWCEDIGYYAYALDGDKKQVKTIASNAGHLLWSGIVRPERAARVVQRLLEPDMWSGWGIRTLSEQNPAFNPFSYQNGSVWPHDNGIIAMGFRRYGFAEEAARIARDISEAASYFMYYRLPELYAGMKRELGSFPVQYLGANVPQAWAAGSVFHLLRAMLGLEADAQKKTLTVDPALPHWLRDITLRKLRVGKAMVDIRFWREGEVSRHEVLGVEGELHVKLREP